MKHRTLGLIATLALATAVAHAVDKPTGSFTSATGAGKPQPTLFKRLDDNQDGRITRAEAEKSMRMAAQFDALDTNKDGHLSPQELQAYNRAGAGAEPDKADRKRKKHDGEDKKGERKHKKHDKKHNKKSKDES